MSVREVVITGMSIASAAGYALEESLAAVREGGAKFTRLTGFATPKTAVQYAGICPDPDLKRLPDRKVTKILRRKDVISLIASLDAAQAAGVTKGAVNPERFGMFVGASSTQIGDLSSYVDLVKECVDPKAGTYDPEMFGAKLMGTVNPLVVLQTLMNNALCYGATALDIRGVNTNFMDFQCAGLRAVGEGYRAIAEGRADIVLAGGVAVPVEPFQLAEGVRVGHIARTDKLTGPAESVVRPWDAGRCGAILSEGSAYVILEAAEHAQKRGAKVLARLRGFGLCADATFDFHDQPSAPGLGRCVRAALSEAKVATKDLGMIVGHANGSPTADALEARAYIEVLADAAKSVPLMSPKAALGDLCEAGGVVALIIAVDALRRGEVPPTLNYVQGDKHSAALAISAKAQPCRHPHALVTARNFLGSSTAVVIGAA